MKNKRSYFGIKRVDAPSVSNVAPATFGESVEENGSLLGDKIIEAANYGADLGAPVAVTFDEDVKDDSSTHKIDMLSSPNMDFFDIAEQAGHMVEAMQPAPPADDEITD